MNKLKILYPVFTVILITGSFFLGTAFGARDTAEMIRSLVVSGMRPASILLTGEKCASSIVAKLLERKTYLLQPQSSGRESVHPAHRHAEEEYLILAKGSGTGI